MATQAVVGFGGVTRGGKSTLCEHLHRNFPADSVVVEMDQYYWDIVSLHHKRRDFTDCEGFPDWDCFEAIEWERMIADTRRHIQPLADGEQGPLVLVEGTMVLNYRPLSDLLTHRYFLTLPYDVAKQRRSEIAKERFEPVTYFDDIVWPAYLRCLEEQRQNGIDVVFLDGTAPLEENVDKILADIMSH